MTLPKAHNGSDGSIVIVDDDDLYRRMLAGNLEDAGFSVVEFGSGPAAVAYLQGEGNVCLVMLDWHMPEMGGLEVLKRINEAKVAAPVLFLTSYSSHAFEETALLNGAVDFIDKSRSLTILLNRISAVIAGRKGQHPPVTIAPVREPVRCGKLELFTDSAGARWDGERVGLTVAEFNIVHLLVSNAGRDVPHRAIYDTVHGPGFVAGDGENGYRTNVRTLIKRVRRKFVEIDPAFDRIRTYSGFGYRWLTDEEEMLGKDMPLRMSDLSPILFTEE